MYNMTNYLISHTQRGMKTLVPVVPPPSPAPAPAPASPPQTKMNYLVEKIAVTPPDQLAFDLMDEFASMFEYLEYNMSQELCHKIWPNLAVRNKFRKTKQEPKYVHHLWDKWSDQKDITQYAAALPFYRGLSPDNRKTLVAFLLKKLED